MIALFPLSLVRDDTGETLTADGGFVGMLRSDFEGWQRDVAALQAYTSDLEEQARDLRAALRWYGNAHHYQPSALNPRTNEWFTPALNDQGAIARANLTSHAQWQGATLRPTLLREESQP